MTAQVEDTLLALGARRPAMRVDYSSRATDPGPSYDPPLPGTDGWARVRGRAGDLLLIQLKGTAGETKQRKAALRTLGLGRPHSASLRDGTEVSLWGNISLVRDIIAVIILPRKEYALGADVRGEDKDAEYDSLRYGTNTRPGHLWRDSAGDYFAYEFEKESLVSFWSSDCHELSDVLDGLATAGLMIDKGSQEAQIRLQARDTLAPQDRMGSWSELLNDVGKAAISQVVIPVDNGTHVAWHASLRRFHDMEVFRPSITVGSSPPDVLAIRGLARETSAQGFLERIPCRVVTRVEGRVREYPIEPAQR